MTDREKAIVMAYTGKCMLKGNKFQIFHKYVEDIMGKPIMTHEMAFLADVIKENSKADFLALCADESNSENPSEWIPVSERLPENTGLYLISIGDLVTTASFDGHNFRTQTMVRFIPDAWLSLPKPYKAESESKIFPAESESKFFAKLAETYCKGLRDGLMAESEDK